MLDGLFAVEAKRKCLENFPGTERSRAGGEPRADGRKSLHDLLDLVDDFCGQQIQLVRVTNNLRLSSFPFTIKDKHGDRNARLCDRIAANNSQSTGKLVCVDEHEIVTRRRIRYIPQPLIDPLRKTEMVNEASLVLKTGWQDGLFLVLPGADSSVHWRGDAAHPARIPPWSSSDCAKLCAEQIGGLLAGLHGE